MKTKDNGGRQPRGARMAADYDDNNNGSLTADERQ
jgi:hypothetical protein